MHLAGDQKERKKERKKTFPLKVQVLFLLVMPLVIGSCFGGLPKDWLHLAQRIELDTEGALGSQVGSLWRE